MLKRSRQRSAPITGKTQSSEPVSPSRIIVGGILILTGLYLVCFVALTLAQRKLLYFPCKVPIADFQAQAAKSGFQPWSNPKREIIGWVRLSPSGRASRKILLLHGNAGCASDWFHYAEGFESVEPVDFYILEYPGYGGRAGSPTQATILRAAEEAFNTLGPGCSISLVGESLGTGPACYLAGKHDEQIAGLLLVAPYNNLTAAAQTHLPLFPVKWILKDRYPSDQWLEGYHGPLAVVLAEKDTVVPCHLGRKLFEGFRGSKMLWTEPGATHDDVHRPRGALYRQIIEFWSNSPHAASK